MRLRDRARAGLARQLGRPEGAWGRLVMRGLNRGNRDIVHAAVSATGLHAGDVAADMGFGGGVGLRPLLDRVGPGGRVHGVELSDTALAVAGRQHETHIASGRLTLHAGDLVALPLPDQCLDAVITVNTLYFVQDLDQALTELARTLRPGGRLVVGVGDLATMSAMPVTAHGFRLRPVAELTDALWRSGFGDVRDQRVDEERGFHLLVGVRQGRTA